MAADYYMIRLMQFLRGLSENNNREWFNARKDEYLELRTLWINDLDRLIGAMSEWDPAMRRQQGRDATYRIYRDTRFKQDKTPYKTYFSALLSPWGRKTDRAAYYLEIDAEKGELCGGLWHPESAVLRKMRHAITDNVEEWESIINEPEFVRLYGTDWWGTPLKTAPKGWPADHAQIEYLRLTDYGKSATVDAEFFMHPDWTERASEYFRVLRPMIDFFNYSIDETV